MRSLVLALLLASGPAFANPVKVLGDYLKAEQRGEYTQAHALLDDADRAARSLDAYTDEHLRAGPLWHAVARRTRFDLKVVRRSPTLATVAVTATHPDIEALAAIVPGLPPEVLAASSDPDALMLQHVESVLAERPVPLRADTQTYAVRRDDGDTWRVWLAFAQQDEAIRQFVALEKALAAGDEEAARAAVSALIALEDDPSGVVDTLRQRATSLLPPGP